MRSIIVMFLWIVGSVTGVRIAVELMAYGNQRHQIPLILADAGIAILCVLVVALALHCLETISNNRT